MSALFTLQYYQKSASRRVSVLKTRRVIAVWIIITEKPNHYQTHHFQMMCSFLPVLGTIWQCKIEFATRTFFRFNTNITTH